MRFYPPVDSGQNVIRQDLALTTAGTLVLPTDKGIPFEVAGTWTLELSGSTALGTQPGARATFLVNAADGSEVTTPAGSTASHVPVQVSVVDQSTTSAPFVTTTATDAAANHRCAVTTNGVSRIPPAVRRSSPGVATSNCS